MPEHVNRVTVALYDQDEEGTIADWGGDDLFTRMPARRVVDDAPAPRCRPALTLVEPPREPRFARGGGGDDAGEPREDRRRPSEPPVRAQAERPHLAAVAEPRFAPAEDADPGAVAPAPSDHPAEAPTVRRWDGSPALDPSLSPTRVITGRPDGPPRPVRAFAERPRPRRARTPSDWIGARPERIVAWAFALGLLLILIAISTADAATV